MIAIILVFATSVLSKAWTRRAYFNDTTCGGVFTMGEQTYDQASVCANEAHSFDYTCEAKSTQFPFSAESSGCSTDILDDHVWFPSSAIGNLKIGNYLTVNSYTNAQCAVESGFGQDTFLADGECYAAEWDQSFFKASCTGSTAILKVCSDRECKNCNKNLNAGIMQDYEVRFETNVCTLINGQPKKMVCTSPESFPAGSSLMSGGVMSGGVIQSINNPNAPSVSNSALNGSTNASFTPGPANPSLVDGKQSSEMKLVVSIGLIGAVALALLR